MSVHLKIQAQATIAIIMLIAIVLALTVASFQGAAKFRSLSKSIQERSLELPKCAKLGQDVSELRSILWKLNHQTPQQFSIEASLVNDGQLRTIDRSDFTKQLHQVELALEEYQLQMEYSKEEDDLEQEDRKREALFVREFKDRLKRMRQIVVEEDPTDRVWHHDQIYTPLEYELSELQNLAAELPIFMQQRTESFAVHARNKYKAWIWVTGVAFVMAIAILAGLVYLFYRRIMQPLRILVNGSREVAGGNFDHRIKLRQEDELSELGEALNSMTEKFQAIKRDLNRQVQERTKEVVRSEKMASVGFLAAGVAHEINNPLASIAWSAESLESRVHDILLPLGEMQEDQQHEIDDMKIYLRRIQDEAFRVKEITGSLLDFARLGDVQKHATNINQLIESVIDIVKPLSKYRHRNILFQSDASIVMVANEQELKQVVLNLITNALGSVEENGTVEIELSREGESAVLVVSDDGCGMCDEVKQHLFEPFFSRHRDGQGTGLGLSITYQIIEEHGGSICAYSAGVGRGSKFTVRLPLVKNEQKLAKSA